MPLALHPCSPVAVSWEVTACPLCGEDEADPLVTAGDPLDPGRRHSFTVVRCRACGLGYTNPRPDQASIGRFYPPDYAPHRGPRGARRPVRCPEHRPLPWHGGGRLLDLGCGRGDFLAVMAARGWRVLGLDCSEAAVARVRGLGLPALAGTLPHPDLAPGSFDVVTLWHSLEHHHDPLAVLRHARELLVPGGKLYAAVPTLDSAGFRWFGPDWYGLDLPRHLVHFTPATLPAMLERAGFAVRGVRRVCHASWLRSSARQARRRGGAAWWHRALGRRLPARVASWACHLTGASDTLLVEAVPAVGQPARLSSFEMDKRVACPTEPRSEGEPWIRPCLS